MIVGAGGKSPGSMAVATILVTGHAGIVRIGWHVRIEKCGKWFACGSNAMACLAIVHDTRVVKDSISKTFCIMTPATIFSSVSMRLCICRRCGINARVNVVT